MAEAYIINDNLEDLKEMVAELEWPENLEVMAHFLEKLDTMRLAVSVLYGEALDAHYVERDK